MLAVFVPVAGLLPQRAIDQLGGADFLVAGGGLAAAHVVLGGAIQAPAFRVPEDAADGFFLDVEQVHVLADTAVVAALGFFQLVEVGLQLLGVAPGSAVDARQHGVAVIAAPIRAGDLHQLEGGADVAGGAHVRAAAEIDPVALAVEGDDLVRGEIADQFGFVALAFGLEEGDGLVAVVDLAGEGGVAGDDLAHLGFDRREVLGGERGVAGEIVVEAVLDCRADGDLGAGEEFLHGFGQHVARCRGGSGRARRGRGG